MPFTVPEVPSKVAALANSSVSRKSAMSLARNAPGMSGPRRRCGRGRSGLRYGLALGGSAGLGVGRGWRRVGGGWLQLRRERFRRGVAQLERLAATTPNEYGEYLRQIAAEEP